MIKNLFSYWQFWALSSAVFAAFTAIFAKIGIKNINSNLATFFRTIVILICLAIILIYTNKFKIEILKNISSKNLILLILSGLATGGSWICYFKALQMGQACQVAPIDKLSVVLVAILGVLFLNEKLCFIHWIGILLIFIGVIANLI